MKQEALKNSEKRRNYYNERDGVTGDESEKEVIKVTELDEELDDVTFKDVKSSSSCKISDI